MPRIAYDTDWKPRGKAVEIIARANEICADYRSQGYDLTLRQLYYQFVARDLIPNRQESYKSLGSIVNKGRLAGMIDWTYIVDRTRSLSAVGHWDSPREIIETAADGYSIDKWEGQPARVEVWVEKEALAGVVQRVSHERDIAYFSCRGYVSQSELWRAGRRHLNYLLNGQRVVILHLGDHDPSGIDMTRDITDRLRMFVFNDWYSRHHLRIGGGSTSFSAIEDDMQGRLNLSTDVLPLEVKRIALNMDQIEEYQPPPNPAKLTDSRSEGYIAQYGDESWELDALDPGQINALIAAELDQIVDEAAYAEREERELEEIAVLRQISENYDEVSAFAADLP